MQNRQAFSSVADAPRAVGKFYQTQRVSAILQPSRPHDLNRPPAEPIQQPIKSRTKSVGHIYSTKCSASKEPKEAAAAIQGSQGAVGSSTRIDYDRLINYREVENKLSSYLECTIRTSSRQKYNYLTTHYNQRYDAGQFRTAQHHPNTRQDNLLKVTQTISQANQPRPLKERNTHITQENIQKPQQRIIELPEKAQKTTHSERTDKPSLKNSRKTDSKQRLTSNQSASKNSNKENILPFSTIPSKKEGGLGLASMNHEEHKSELENKLKKLISNYEVKNKELENQLRNIEIKPAPAQSKELPKKDTVVEPTANAKEEAPVYTNEQLKEILSQLEEFNLKGINLSREAEEKQEEIWRSIHHQVVADEHLRIVKCLINDNNIQQVFALINQNRVKKVDLALLKTHPDEYDPFLIEKAHQLLATNNPDLAHSLTCKWIADQFARAHEAAEKNWLKQLSQEKMECTIRTMVLEKEVTSLRKSEGSGKELPIRDFTRHLSTLFKANLRNRNVYQVHARLRNMSYLGRFIELLEDKTARGKPKPDRQQPERQPQQQPK